MMEVITEEKVPVLRFPEFEGEWEIKKAKELFINRRKKGGTNLPIYSVTLDRGLVPRSSFESRTFTDATDEDNLVAFPKDIVYNMMRMWQGALGIAYQTCMVSPAYVILQPKEDVHSEFYNYLLKTGRYLFLLESYSYGLTSDRLRLYYKDFSLMNLPKPSLLEQLKVTVFLTAIDAKIQQLTKKKSVLEQYKKGVMQHIFSQRISFKDDNGEEYPDWEEKRLGDFLSIPKKEKPIDVDRSKLLTVKLHQKGIVRNENTDTLSLGSTYFIRRKGQFIYGKQNIFNGAFGIVPVEFDGFLSSTDIPALDINSIDPTYLMAFLGRRSYYSSLENIASGSGSKRIHEETLLSIVILLPTLPEQQKITAFLKGIDTKIKSVAAQIETTQTYKKGLLQQLFV